MFTLHHLKGNTYYIDAPTNMGVYKINEKDCILIDTCYAGSMTDKLVSTLSHYDLNIVSILHTHAHIDHFGSDSHLKSKYNCTIGSPSIEYIFIENPELFNSLIFIGSPFSHIKVHDPSGTKVDFFIDENNIIVHDIPFSTYPLKGHSVNQRGVITPDDVIFSGDAYLDVDELQKVKMLYNYDVKGAMDSLKSLLNTDYSIYVPSHGNPSGQINDTIQYNIKNLENNANVIFDILKKSPLSLDELMSILIKRYKITEKVAPYLIAQSCVTSLLSYLENQGLINIVFENGFMKFTATV